MLRFSKTTLLTFLLLPAAALPAVGATLTVVNSSDSGPGSLRDTIANAAPGDTITFSLPLPATITTSGLAINQNLTITGPGKDLLTISGGDLARVLNIGAATVTIQNLTIAHGVAAGGGGGGILNAGALTVTGCAFTSNIAASGGAIFNGQGATLTVSGSSFTGNSATGGGSFPSNLYFVDGDGGAIYTAGSTTSVDHSTFSNNSGAYGGAIKAELPLSSSTPVVLQVTASTLSGNLAAIAGGAISNVSKENGAIISLTRSTVSGNQGGGLHNYLGGLTLVNSTVWGNSGTGIDSNGGGVSGPSGRHGGFMKNSIVGNNQGRDCSVFLTWEVLSVAFDTDGTCPGFTLATAASLKLGPLADNGGPTLTHALLPGSVAVDAATDGTDYSGNPVPTDQRGFPRPAGDSFDVGAFELPAPQSIGVTPSSLSLAFGKTQQYTATAVYAGGATLDVTSTAVWQSSNPSVATVTGAGFVSALTAGSTTISAMRYGLTGSATLNVYIPVLQSIAVTPASATIFVGKTQQFVAIGAYSDGSTANLTGTVSWTSSNTRVATIGGSGVATGVAAGSVTITAESGKIGSASLTVVAPTLQSISVTPASSSVAAGGSQQFTATGTYSDGSISNLTAAVSWQSSNTKVASISNAGLAKGVAAGSVTITASSGGKSATTGTATLVVTGGGNNPPLAVDDSATTKVNTAVTIKVLANDSDPDGDKLTVTGIPLAPLNGTASINNNGTVAYTPNSGFTGVDTFQYQISDGKGGTAVATVTVSVLN